MSLSKNIIIIIISVFMLFLVGCSNNTPAVQSTTEQDTVSETASEDNTISTEAITDKLEIVSTLFPHYDFAKIIGGDYVEVTLLLPPGVESHSYEPTPKDIIMIETSDLFLFTSELMEPWAHSILENSKLSKDSVVDMSVGIELLAASDDHDHEGETEEEHAAHAEEGAYDPHYWTDPNNAMIMAESIKMALIQLMPENTAVFESNTEVLMAELKALDTGFIDLVQKSDSKTILSGGHFAFGYLASRYGLEHMSPYVGFSPDAEPTPKRIADLIDTVEATGAKAIFYEELVDPKVAKIISEEANVDMLLLHGAHNISKDELSEGISYVTIMQRNIEQLKKGLNYHE